MKDGFCKFIFKNKVKSALSFYKNMFKLLNNIGYNCFNPFFNTINLHINDEFDSVMLDNMDDFFHVCERAQRIGLTLWKDKDDIWIDITNGQNYNTFMVSLDNLSNKQIETLMNLIYSEITHSDLLSTIEALVIDIAGILIENLYKENDINCIGILTNPKFYNFRLSCSFSYETVLEFESFKYISENNAYLFIFISKEKRVYKYIK